MNTKQLLLIAVTLTLGFSSCKKCITCTYDYYYEYDPFNLGNPIITDDTDVTQPYCDKKKELDKFEDIIKQERADLESEVKATPGMSKVNFSQVVCTREKS